MQAFCNSQFGLSEQAMDGGSADSITFRKLSQAVSSLPIPQDRGAIKNQRCSSDVPAFEFRPPHAGTNPFDDQTALQLRDRADDDHNRPAQARQSFSSVIWVGRGAVCWDPALSTTWPATGRDGRR